MVPLLIPCHSHFTNALLGGGSFLVVAFNFGSDNLRPTPCTAAR
tara:strand:- start:27297 stop:27428 length:132 start_codon:yes stop_codon:yes gene_type:complete